MLNLSNVFIVQPFLRRHHVARLGLPLLRHTSVGGSYIGQFHCITGIQSEQDWFSGSSHEKQRFKMPDTKEKGRTFAHPRIAASGGCAPSRISFDPKGVWQHNLYF